MKRKSIPYLVVLTLVASIVLFSGCVEEKNTAPMETPASDDSPTSTSEQEAVPTPMETPAVNDSPTSTPEQEAVPTPMPTVESAWNPDVTLKPGYKWYQDDDFGYGFAYPEEWEIQKQGTLGAISFYKSNSEGWPPGLGWVQVNNTNSSKILFWEDNPEWNKLGGYEKAKQMGYVYEYSDITINGRKGFEVVYDPTILAMLGASVLNESSYIEAGIPYFTTTWSQKTVIFDVGDLNYIIMFSGSNANYNIYKNTYDNILNSFTIK